MLVEIWFCLILDLVKKCSWVNVWFCWKSFVWCVVLYETQFWVRIWIFAQTQFICPNWGIFLKHNIFPMIVFCLGYDFVWITVLSEIWSYTKCDLDWSMVLFEIQLWLKYSLDKNAFLSGNSLIWNMVLSKI